MHWTTSLTEGEALCSHWNRHLASIRICLLCMKYFCPNDSRVLTESLVYHEVPHTALLLAEELTSQRKKCSNGSVLLELTDLTMFPRSSGFDRTLEWPSEGSVTAPATWGHLVDVTCRCRHLVGLGQGPLGGCTCSKSVSEVWCRFSPSQNSWVQKSRTGNARGITQHYPM